MTIAEAEVFYNMDREKYNLATNKEFLKWYNKQLKNGYSGYMVISEMQDLIDNIVSWYEVKYPERELEYYEGAKYCRFENIRSISKSLSFEQLMFRLPHKQLSIIESNYRARGWSYPDNIHIRVDFVKKMLSYELISANSKTGLVNKIGVTGLNIKNYRNITLDELVKIFDDTKRTDIDYTKVKECVNNHSIDLQLRKRLLQLSALKLLYSKNTIPERGYERAKRFINEFNKHIPNLNLTTSEIDEIIQINYKEEYEKSKSKKLFFK